MKFFNRNIHWLICTLIMVSILLLCLFASNDPTIRFSVESEYGAEEISLYQSGNGIYHVFLPSYADMNQVTILLPFGVSGSLDGVPLSTGMNCGNFRLETEYTLEISGQPAASLQFHRSGNVATMYINTATGSMDQIHGNKNQKGTAFFRLYTPSGALDYVEECGSIKGRGNYTWTVEKKPYSLTLSSDGDLLGMGAATNWVLLANATDQTNLNNKLVYDLAAQVGAAWAPECRYVDLYLNGEYSGLYLLTEKIEVHKERLDIDTDAGDFLCRIEIYDHWDNLQNPFFTHSERLCDVCVPERLTQADSLYIEDLVYQLEQEIFSGQDLSIVEDFDLDSWVRRYLIDEISGNIDGDLASSYFYYSDGVFYAGPVWDYDMTFGNSVRNEDPRAFIAKNTYKFTNNLSLYYDALYKNESFYHRMTEIYETEFLPLLDQLINVGITSLSSNISAASTMNSLRWQHLFSDPLETGSLSSVSADSLVEYLKARVEFLTSAWLDGIPYCTVQFRSAPPETYMCTSVVQGGLLETSYVDLNNTVWIDTKTNQQVDFSQPISEDMILASQLKEGLEDEYAGTPAPEAAGTFATRDYVVFLSVAVIAFLFLCLIVADTRQRSKERRNANGNTRTNVSP